jgi:hypothetical protein
VVWDVFLNAVTTGLFLTTAVAELARPIAFASIAAWAYPVALVILLVDLSCLVLDLGDPLRFHHMLRVFKPSSPMSLGTWCLTVYSLPLTALAIISVLGLLGLLQGDLQTIRTVLLVVGIPFAFGSMAYKGVLFSTSSQPGWRDARWFGAYHTASAVALGCATLMLLDLGVSGTTPELLSTPFVYLVVLQSLSLALLGRELAPLLKTVYAERQLQRFIVAQATPILLAVLLFFIPHVPVLVLAASLGMLAAGWHVRHVLVMLPHHSEGH